LCSDFLVDFVDCSRLFLGMTGSDMFKKLKELLEAELNLCGDFDVAYFCESSLTFYIRFCCDFCI